MDLFTLPTPYPDETWYSIIARYHRRSGNIHSAETRRELFGEMAPGTINPVEMDFSITHYVETHGGTIGSDEECFTRFTLAPYHLRYYSEKRKKEILEITRDAGNTKKINVFTRHADTRRRARLRYCPVCMEEDILKYGESYWHRGHQIWMIKNCVKHGCKLLESGVPLSRASYHFSCADSIFCPDSTISYEDTPFDKFSPYVISSLDAPFTFHANAITDSLVYAAIDTGYGEYQSKGFVCKTEKLYADMKASFGEQFMKNFFDTTEYGSATIRRVFYPSWNSRIEPAVLVAAFFQIPLNNLFKEEDREAKIREELLRCAEHGFYWPKSKIAQHLGVKESRLSSLAKEVGIAPFWDSSKISESNLIPTKAILSFSEKEYEMIEKRMRELHAFSRKEFFMYCIRKELKLIDN